MHTSALGGTTVCDAFGHHFEFIYQPRRVSPMWHAGADELNKVVFQASQVTDKTVLSVTAKCVHYCEVKNLTAHHAG